MWHDCVEISSVNYTDEKTQRMLKSNNDLYTKLELCGNRNDSKRFFEQVSGHVSGTTTTLIFECMQWNYKADDKLPMYPVLSHLAFRCSRIKKSNILRFHEWCPNITELMFSHVRFSAFAWEALCSTDNIYPHMKKLDIHFQTGEITEEKP